MSKESELWSFIAKKLTEEVPVMLLVVCESEGSSPGRVGYKMAVAADRDLCGSIGGGVMEVRLVNEAIERLVSAGDLVATISSQVHRRNADDASGMICSGSQKVIIKPLGPDDLSAISDILGNIRADRSKRLTITQDILSTVPESAGRPTFTFESSSPDRFIYSEVLGPKQKLFIVGGGHCSLALSELMSKMDYYVRIFDDRPELNTIEKNRFADNISVIESYAGLGDLVPSGDNVYVVVMTLGYTSDEVAIRSLFDHNLRYFGVLGSKAKMKTLFRTLKNEGFDETRLSQIRTPIGLRINSQTPEEIAISIAAEIISVKNT